MLEGRTFTYDSRPRAKNSASRYNVIDTHASKTTSYLTTCSIVICVWCFRKQGVTLPPVHRSKLRASEKGCKYSPIVIKGMLSALCITEAAQPDIRTKLSTQQAVMRECHTASNRVTAIHVHRHVDAQGDRYVILRVLRTLAMQATGYEYVPPICPAVSSSSWRGRAILS